MKKTTTYVIFVLTGFACIGISLFMKGESYKNLAGILLGIGATIVSTSICSFIMRQYLRNNPQLSKQTEIDLIDERNIAIRNKARAKAGSILRWLIIIIAYVMILMNVSLWIILATVLISAAHSILEIYYIHYYQKQM